MINYLLFAAEEEEWNEENGANAAGANPDDEEFDGADDDDESELNERDLEEAVNDGNAEGKIIHFHTRS